MSEHEQQNVSQATGGKPEVDMTERFPLIESEVVHYETERLLSNLAELCGLLNSNLQAANESMNVIDGYLTELKNTRLLRRTLVLGSIVLQRNYGIGGPEDSSELIQAAVTTEHGLAAISWDSAEYCEAKMDSDQFELEAMDNAVPLRDCSPAVRALVWPHVAGLVNELLRQATIRRSH